MIDIRNILGLDSSYAMRFYEICKEKERFKTFQYTVTEIKEMFSIEDKYENYFDFKVKIIIQARNELQENSELYFDFEEIKQGKKVVAIRFTVIKNKKNLKRDEDELSILTKELPNHTEVHDSLEEFVGNFNVDGTSQSYVLAKMTPMFNDFQILRDDFVERTKQLGIKDIGLF